MSKQTIRELRTAAGLTQKQLAEAIGVTPHTVYRWERGMVPPHVQSLQAMARLFGVSLDTIDLDTTRDDDGRRKPTRPRRDESRQGRV